MSYDWAEWRFPTQQLVDTYEMKNGKRIDEVGSGYDPKKPFYQ